MQTKAEVLKAAKKAQALVRVLVDIGNMLGPSWNAVEADVDRWYDEMKGTDIRSMASGRVMLTQDIDEETNKGTGYFELYVDVSLL